MADFGLDYFAAGFHEEPFISLLPVTHVEDRDTKPCVWSQSLESLRVSVWTCRFNLLPPASDQAIAFSTSAIRPCHQMSSGLPARDGCSVTRPFTLVIA